jgi:N-acetylmuramoyl-L-alanine amidase
LCIFFILFSLSSIIIVNATENDQNKVILIDPGHGGIDSGAISRRGSFEKDINLSISIKLKEKLQEAGYTVLMTRESDIGLYTNIRSSKDMKYEDLYNRCRMKKDSNCDVFISIHQNYFTQSQYYGSQVWYGKSKKSKLLAEIIQANMIKSLNHSNKREAKAAGEKYKVLRCYNDITSVIIECGFITNPREEIQLKNETYQWIIADSINDSLKEFFNNLGSI